MGNTETVGAVETTVIQIQPLTIITIVAVVAVIILLSVCGTVLVQTLLTRLKKNSGCGKNNDTCSKEKCIELHRKDMHYIEIIFTIILIFLLVDLFIGNKDALEYFSFASTIASIILSVLAIMMTIFSDAKNENTKSLIYKSVATLEDAISSIDRYTENMAAISDEQKKTFESILENSRDILNRTKSLEKSIEEFGIDFRHSDSKDFGHEEYKSGEEGF